MVQLKRNEIVGLVDVKYLVLLAGYGLDWLGGELPLEVFVLSANYVDRAIFKTDYRQILLGMFFSAFALVQRCDGVPSEENINFFAEPVFGEMDDKGLI